MVYSFEPREMCLAKDAKRLIVAGSFKNTLAVFDTPGLELISTDEIPGHNIRSLAISGDGKRLYITQQELNSLARSTRDDVYWGNMVSNLFVSLRLRDLCDPQADILTQRVVHYLGEPGNAAGDPGPIDIALECQNCHTPQVFTAAGAFDVGLVDEVGNKRFNPPSLGGAGRRNVFFHDASAKSLKEVLVDRRHQLSRDLSAAELDSLLQFLRSI